MGAGAGAGAADATGARQTSQSSANRAGIPLRCMEPPGRRRTRFAVGLGELCHRSGSPEDIDFVLSQESVSRDQLQPLQLCLGNKDSVERITVMRWQSGSMERVAMANR